mmetsp:Transcript_13418/g.29139  ORF Transcript_13418/g.29139 Transcript_13418/m.29139 type:complete len:376 (-) Transcript_13418:296-1423(-)
MSIVLSEATNAHQAMKSAGSLITVHGPELSPTDWQIAIRSKLILVHEAVEGAVHGFDLIFLILHLHLLKHAIAVKVVVARGFPQIQIGNVGRVNNVVIVVNVFRLPKFFNVPAYDRPFGMPKYKTTTSIFLNGKQIKLLSKDAMVALLRLLHHLLVPLELAGILPGRGINALEHFAILVAPPIRTGHRLERNRLLRELSRRLDVRAGAKIPPLVPDLVDGNRFRLDGFENLKLEGFSDIINALDRLLPSNLLPNDGMVGPYDLVHPLLNLLEILIGQLPARYRLAGFRIGRFGEEEIVVEAIINPRADGNLSFREDLLDCHGHNVRGRVTETEQFVVAFVGWEIFLDGLRTGLLSDGSGKDSSCVVGEPPRLVRG